MISGLDELRRGHAVLEECKQQLRSSKIEMAERVEVGAM